MNTKAKKLFSSRAFKSGSYAAAISAIAVIICIAVNLIFTALPTGTRIIDLSGTGLFSLSDESIKAIEGLDTDVSIYYLAETGMEDIGVTSLLDKYSALSSKIKVEYKDPVLYPTFASKYNAESAQTGSIIVASGEKSRLVPANEMYEQIPNYQTYTYDTSFAAEGRITGAISYVTRTDLPKLYTLNGHDTQALSENASAALAQKNYDMAELNLLTEGAVPGDASAVLLYSPTKDLSADELSAMREYLAGGGSLLLATDFNADAQFENLYTLLAEYGLSYENGIIIEGDGSFHLKSNPHYLIPEIAQTDITAPLTKSNSIVMMPLSFPIITAESLPEGVSVTPLLKSTNKSYLKAAAYEAQTMEKESGDLEGPFNVAVLAEKTNGNETGSIVWYSSTGILDEVSDSMVSGTNTDMFINTIAFLAGAQNDISISAKPITTPTVTLPAATVSLLSALFIIILPLALVICGFVIWFKRRRR